MDTSEADPGGKDEVKTEVEEDTARPEGVVRFVLKDFSRLRETILSDPIYIRNLPWLENICSIFAYCVYCSNYMLI